MDGGLWEDDRELFLTAAISPVGLFLHNCCMFTRFRDLSAQLCNERSRAAERKTVDSFMENTAHSFGCTGKC